MNPQQKKYTILVLIVVFIVVMWKPIKAIIAAIKSLLQGAASVANAAGKVLQAPGKLVTAINAETDGRIHKAAFDVLTAYVKDNTYSDLNPVFLARLIAIRTSPILSQDEKFNLEAWFRFPKEPGKLAMSYQVHLAIARVSSFF